MIANTSSGRRFGPLAAYLVHGRSGEETARVAWTASRNLGTDDPETAAALMQATARQSVLVQSPVYHLTISFDPADVVTPAQMQAVADRVLHDLGLSAHQVVMVAHQDRAHPHVHLMINRVHPETGVAWERWQDRPRIEETLRHQERALGLRHVEGRLYQIDGRDPADQEHPHARQTERSDDGAFRDRVRGLLPEIRAARSWEELATRLAAHELRIEGKGQGLVITDGQHEVKASRVARDVSLRRLEDRFGAPYPAREELHGSRAHAEAALSPAALDVAASAREVEYVERLQRAAFQLGQDRAVLRVQRDQFAQAVAPVTAARDAFDHALTLVYRDPDAAHQAIHDTASTLGADRVRHLLREEPERFGALRTVDRPRAFGLMIVDDDAQARDHALEAAAHWRDLAARGADATSRAATYVRTAEQRFRDAVEQLYRAPTAAHAAIETALQHASPEDVTRVLAASPDRYGALRAPGTPVPVAQLEWAALAEGVRHAIDARRITSSELAHAHAEHALARTETRHRALEAALADAPRPDLLRRGIRRMVDRLEPRELASLRRALTSPQAAIAFTARTAVRDAVLGRDEYER